MLLRQFDSPEGNKHLDLSQAQHREAERFISNHIPSRLHYNRPIHARCEAAMNILRIEGLGCRGLVSILGLADERTVPNWFQAAARKPESRTLAISQC